MTAPCPLCAAPPAGIPAHAVTPLVLARAFARSVTEELTHPQLARLLTHPKASPCCVSHDFMDANMNMLGAYETLLGHTYDGDLNDVIDLFNAAWDLARDRDWFIGTEDVS